MKIIWSPRAMGKISELSDFIAEDSPSRATTWLESIFESIFESVEQLSEFPEIGRILPNQQDQNLRQLIIDNYHIIYRINKKQIRILVIRNFKDNKLF
jgi:toxin ParE1/3/4